MPKQQWTYASVALVLVIATGALGARRATAQQPTELLVRGGVVVTAEGRVEADIRARDGRVVEIGAGLIAADGARAIDAAGLLILPGGIDPHVHLGGSRADDYTSGSAAALAGGITTIANFVSPRDGEGLLDAIRREAETVRAQAIADVILHPILADPDSVPGELEAMAAAGHTSLKVFMVSRGFDLNVAGFVTTLQAAGDAGFLMMMHPEDAAMVALAGQRLMAAGRTSLEFFPQARPVLAEEVATQRAVAMSEFTGAPIYLVHLSSARALRVAEGARARGLPVYVETRPIYLHFTEERFEGPDRGLFVGQPPLRTAADRAALWAGLGSGSIDVVGTDHVAYRREQKLDPAQTVVRHRAGLNNLQVMRPLLYSEGVVTGRLTIERFVALTATNPARLFGLYPQKGTIAVGSDADLVLWDADETRTVRDADMLSGSGYSVYSGWEATGWPHMTIRRGEVVYEDGRIVVSPGSGELLHRGPSRPPVGR